MGTPITVGRARPPWLVAVSALTSVLVSTFIGGFSTVKKLDHIEVSLNELKEDACKHGKRFNALNPKFDCAYGSLVEERKEIANLAGQCLSCVQ